MHKIKQQNKIDSECISTILNNVTTANDITEWRHSMNEFTTLGQNYFGELIPVILSGKVNEELCKRIYLVLKLAPTDERFRVSGAITSMFNREIFIYSVLLKKYKELQGDLKPESKYVIPACYYISDEYCREVIVMEDMCAAGYKPYTDKRFLDLNHIYLSLETLAKFHALSFILNKKDIDLYREVERKCLPLTEEHNKRFTDILIDRLTKALQKFDGSEYVPLLEKLRQNCITHIESAYRSVNKLCICHGDIWKENILFKYKDKKPISACIIDYQTTRMCSPAFDVLYLIITSTDSELRSEHFYKLLDDYYQIFDGILKEKGLESEELYSEKMFKDDLKIVAPACFIVANTALWLSNGLQTEGHVVSKNVYSTEEDKARATNNYISVIKNILDDFDKYGYL